MRSKSNIVLGVLAASLSSASAQEWVWLEPDVAVHNASTSSWVKAEKLPNDELVSFTVVVKIDDARLADLERVFWEVSDPKHNNYGKYLSLDGITELLAIPDERHRRLAQYFTDNSAVEAKTSPNHDMISVTMPAAAVEATLRTSLHFFTHQEDPSIKIVRASSRYGLPKDIAENVVMIGELLQFPRIRSRSNSNAAGQGSWPNSCSSSACAGLVTPSVLAQRYKLPQSDDGVSSSNSMAVAEFQGQFFEKSDLDKFSQSCHADVVVAKVVGQDSSSAGIEAELDIEYIRAVAPSVPLTVIYNNMYSLLSWANQITSMSDPPLVHSVSYGNDEAQQSSTQYMFTANTAFMKAGARGLSILFASGDQGVCGREGCGIFKFIFKPDFPAASPYITAVGGTDFLTSSIGDEMAWTDGGGGFSNTFGIPDYQKAAVASYMSNPDANLPPQQYWNASGRGYPDVAALGGQKAPYCIATGGAFTGVAGTSASCPVVAGVFARLNGLRLSAGKPAMGFLNPFIYQNPSAFQDVTHGVNSAGRKYGFTACKGWDAATGFGTPDFERLSRAAMAAEEAAVVV